MYGISQWLIGVASACFFFDMQIVSQLFRMRMQRFFEYDPPALGVFCRRWADMSYEERAAYLNAVHSLKIEQKLLSRAPAMRG